MKNKRNHWFEYEKHILPIINTFFDTEAINYTIKERKIEGVLYYKNESIELMIIKEYNKGEKFITKDIKLQQRLNEILNLGFTYYSWLEDRYKRNPQISISF